MRRLSEKERILSDQLASHGLSAGPVLWYDSVHSTMDVAFRAGGRHPSNRTLVISDAQTRGRGTHGRKWRSAAGDLQLSLLLTEFDFRVPYSMVASLGVYRTFRSYTDRVRLKWVNDLLWENGKKIAGVLTEERGGLTVIGMGVNLNSTKMSEDLAGSATSFTMETGQEIDITAFLTRLLTVQLGLLDELAERGPAGPLAEWEVSSGIRGRTVRVSASGTLYEGVVAGINRESGALILRCPREVVEIYGGCIL
jgi:BirA family biotin operon repressor/biotin-[acetyl-CoA-carboxylase] ligase